jgi:gamma-glutamylputrescine oxidase
MEHLNSLTYYAATKKYDLSFPSLEQDIDVDVVIIGGGFTGINTALELAEKGITDIAILEAKHLGYGGTGRNGGQIMAGLGHDINTVKKHVGKDRLEELFKLGNIGASIIRERVEKYNIDADFCQGYTYLGFNRRQEKPFEPGKKSLKKVTPDEEITLHTG